MALVSTVVMAEPPYKINGFHTDLVFTEALALAEGLGGDCEISVARRRDNEQRALCEYLLCAGPAHSEACENQTSSGPSFAGQPIVQIAFDAPTESSSLSRIILLYEGSTEAVEDSLTEMYGTPRVGGDSSRRESKSDSRRLNWQQDSYRIGLVVLPRWIILTPN